LLHVNWSTVGKLHKAKLASVALKRAALMVKTITTVQPAVIHVFATLCHQRSHFAFNTATVHSTAEQLVFRQWGGEEPCSWSSEMRWTEVTSIGTVSTECPSEII